MIRITIEIEEGSKPNVIVKNDNHKEVKSVTIPSRMNVNHDQGLKEKKCIVCGKSFTPLSGAQKRCSLACGMKPKAEKEKVNKESTPIEEILAEVQQSQSKPYEFGK